LGDYRISVQVLLLRRQWLALSVNLLGFIAFSDICATPAYFLVDQERQQP